MLFRIYDPPQQKPNLKSLTSKLIYSMLPKFSQNMNVWVRATSLLLNILNFDVFLALEVHFSKRTGVAQYNMSTEIISLNRFAHQQTL